MNIAYNTLSENPLSGSGSLDFFIEMAKYIPQNDNKNNYYFIVSKLGKANFQNVNTLIGGYSNERKIARIISEQILLPIKLSRNKIDLLFTTSSGGIAPLLTPKGIKIILGVFATQHLKSNLLDLKRRLYRNILLKNSLKSANIIVVNSNICKADVLNTNIVTEEKIRVIPHGIDFECFHSKSTTKYEEKYFQNYQLHRPYILFVSSLYPYKNVHTLVEAFGRFLIANKTNHELVLIGNYNCDKNYNNYMNSVYSIANKYNIKNRIRYLGKIPKDKLRVFYKKAEIYVQPSFYETFGKTTLEAMACGCPVIGSNTSATPEVLGNCGLLFDPYDVNDLKIKIETMISDQLLKNKFVNNGLVRAQNYSLFHEAQNYVSIFNDVN